MIDIFVGTPAKSGQIFSLTAQAMMRLAQVDGIHVTWATIMNDPYVHCARDALANKFLDATKATHLLFVDDDVVFEPNDVVELLNANKGVIGGIYPQKKIDWDHTAEMAKHYSGHMLDHVSSPSWLFLPGQQGKFTGAELKNPIEVEAMATGFMLIQRNVLERYRTFEPTRYRNSRYGDKELTPFFYLGIHGNTQAMIGEDVNFCMKLKEMGEKIYTLPGISLGHAGFHVYHGCAWCSLGTPIHAVRA